MESRWKKVLVTGWLTIGLCLSAIPQVASSEPVRAGRMLETIARAYPTPEQLALFLHKNVFFQEDVRLFGLADYWQDPEEFLDRRKGDCEDYALLAQAVLLHQGQEAFVFSLYGEQGYAHTVCVFVEKGCYNVINQDRVIRYHAKSLEDLATYLYPQWNWGAVAERVGHRGRAIREIYNHNTVDWGKVSH